ncbi:hypothetical protein JCGZ_22816 [Jatropha curcas]|uniref:Uncharacterized protein n=1 Tax=Jatropha curcas TaxID=180498 RepID=A0A067LGJ0_JATCU|nr:hypothetical protein JCGZ_22816 [Jatropha curcas]
MAVNPPSVIDLQIAKVLAEAYNNFGSVLQRFMHSQPHSQPSKQHNYSFRNEKQVVEGEEESK